MHTMVFPKFHFSMDPINFFIDVKNKVKDYKGLHI